MKKFVKFVKKGYRRLPLRSQHAYRMRKIRNAAIEYVLRKPSGPRKVAAMKLLTRKLDNPMRKYGSSFHGGSYYTRGRGFAVYYK